MQPTLSPPLTPAITPAVASTASSIRAPAVGALVGATGDLGWRAYYLIIAGIVGAVSIFFTLEPNGRRMWGSSPGASSKEEARELVKAA